MMGEYIQMSDIFMLVDNVVGCIDDLVKKRSEFFFLLPLSLLYRYT